MELLLIIIVVLYIPLGCVTCWNLLIYGWERAGINYINALKNETIKGKILLILAFILVSPSILFAAILTLIMLIGAMLPWFAILGIKEDKEQEDDNQ